MKIAFDITPLYSPHQFRGVGSYTKNLAEFLPKIDKKNKYLFFRKGESIPKVDLVHYPYFDLFFLTLPVFKKCPVVVTIYDVIPLIYPDHFPAGLRGWIKLHIQRWALAGVAKVITISQNSKKDIGKYLDVPEEKIEVAYLAPAPIFKPIKESEQLTRVRQKYNLPEEFILYVGDLNYNKNLPNLFKALEAIDQTLVMVGRATTQDSLPELRELLQLSVDLGIEKRVLRLGFIPEGDLVVIYNLAKVYVQPSLYEGFGLPVLDAMASGTPVVCSRTSSLPEVAGEAAIYIDPEDPKSIAWGIKKVLNFSSLKLAELREKELRQASQFSWEKTARKTTEIYESLV